MENNYNFNIDPQPLKKEAVNKHKDFDALLKRMEAVEAPPKKDLKVASKKLYYWISGIAATLLIGVLAFNALNSTNNQWENATKTYLAAQPYVNPPIERLTTKGETVIVDANNGGTYTFPSGSRMVVPKSAFANSYGALIEGEVEIHFKEYHDYVDIFLSGIPMEIKVDGKDQILESAGMIEVYATQDGERLQMLPEKPIDIELKSKIAFAGDTPPDFNIYYLDEENRNWDLRGKDKIDIQEGKDENMEARVINTLDSLGNVISSTVDWVHINHENHRYNYFKNETETSLTKTLETTKQNIEIEKNAQIRQVEKIYSQPKAPQKPEQYDGNSMTFEFDLRSSDLKGRQYEGTIFQVLKAVEDFEMISTTVWEEPILEKQSDGSFLVKLQKGEKQAELAVKPVLVGGDYEKAVQQFEAQLADYQKERAALAAKIAAEKQRIEDRASIEKQLADKTFEEQMAALKAKGHHSYATNEIVKRAVTNKFRITQFGTWNCDRPRPLYLAILDGTFQDQKLNRYQNTIVYHTDKSRNTVSRFYLKDVAKVQYNDNSENLFWLVTDENKLAVFPSEYFERITQKEGAYAFEMDLHEQAIDSEADVRAILKL